MSAADYIEPNDLNEEEEDILLLQAYSGKFDQLLEENGGMVDIDNVKTIDMINKNTEDGDDDDIVICVETVKPTKLPLTDAKLELPENVIQYFNTFSKLKEELSTRFGERSNEEYRTNDNETRSNRYYSLTCRECGEYGHISSSCMQRAKNLHCFLCGGNHLSKLCPNQLCYRCNTPGHLSRDCRGKLARRTLCFRCDGDHSPTECRLYVSPNKKLKSCFNCGQSDHSAYACRERRCDEMFLSKSRSDGETKKRKRN